MTNVNDPVVRLEDIDFDDENKVKELGDRKVMIPVGVLSILLDYYYTGGGEPDSRNERLQAAFKNQEIID